MKMLEEILSDAVPHTISAEGKQDLRSAEVFVIDNVAEYLYAQTDQEEWDVKSDFPCLAPPFPSFWMEYGRPSKIVSRIHGTQSNRDLPYRIGLWFQAMEPGDLVHKLKAAPEATNDELRFLAQELEKRLTPQIDRELRTLHEAGISLFSTEAKERLSAPAKIVLNLLGRYKSLKAFDRPGFEDGFRAEQEVLKTRWMVLCLNFMQMARHGPIIGPIGQHVLYLSETGAVADQQCSFNAALIQEKHWADGGGGISTIWFPGLLAISFCHCKNVTIRAAETVPEKLARRQKERGRLPGLAYKVLEIGPMKAVLERTQTEHATGLKRALHICRGHFALYEDNGLFGKYKGRFWIPQHLRGSIQQGAIEKTYDVKAGAR
jgi:hypothetical protein